MNEILIRHNRKMNKHLILSVAALSAALMFAGCGYNVPEDAKPLVDLGLREFGVPAKCLDIKEVKNVGNEKDSFTAVAVCDFDGKRQTGDITVKYKDGKPAVGIIGFGYPEIMRVKNGVLKIDTSRTVAAALSANLANLKWEKFVNRKNQIVVKATGTWKGSEVSQSIFLVTICLTKPGKKVEAYFTINRDGGFSFADAKISGSESDLGMTFATQKEITPSYFVQIGNGKMTWEEARAAFLEILYD